MSNSSSFWENFKRPPKWAAILNGLITFSACVGSLCVLLTDFSKMPMAILAYALFGIAACSLSYSVYLLIRFAPRVKKGIINWAEKYEFTRSLLRNYGFRTIVLTIGSFALSIAFGIYNGVLGLMMKSIWFGALAAYYILLALLRGSVLTYHRKKKTKKHEDSVSMRTRVYRKCGFWLLILNVALSVAIAQMIFSDRKFIYAGWTIYAFAAYAFYKITMSIINLFKARKQTDMTVQAIRNVNLADAAVSILALQTALLGTFSAEGVNVSLFNTLTGIAVSLLSIGIGVEMVVYANKKLKEIRGERRNGK
ncbi:MAG: hypothetical protein IJY05_01170 [Clostridia bacterium]|nr:hypothetical protein [Clostridia bacterium]